MTKKTINNKLLNDGKQLRNKILLNVAIKFYNDLQVHDGIQIPCNCKCNIAEYEI
jgi:hypothetical protein